VDDFGGGHGAGRSLNRAAPTLGGLAGGDFSAIADNFSNAGFTVRVPAPGILLVSAADKPGLRLCLLLSVGVHGDETGPIEMLELLLNRLASEPHTLRVDLMIVVGNPAAIALGRRYVDSDLNRMFERDGTVVDNVEVERAAVIMRATDQFFSTAGAGRWHLDLHTAIRASLFPTFAIVPDLEDAEARDGDTLSGDARPSDARPSDARRSDARRSDARSSDARSSDARRSDARSKLTGWLGDAGIGAVVLNTRPSGTYSAWTAKQFGALSCTAELGRVARLGQNDLSQLATVKTALHALLTGGAIARGQRPQHFVVAQEIIKTGDLFYLCIAREATNFEPMSQGDLIAEDGERQWTVGAETEFLLFPNQDVAVGQRAALMVVPVES
jgi:succinylglutamate desuccinylase